MNQLSDWQRAAMGRWNELGSSMRTNPVLELAYGLYYAPMGAVCADMVYNPFDTLENAQNAPFFDGLYFDPKKVDKTWGQYSVVEPLLNYKELVEPVFSEDGLIKEFNVAEDQGSGSVMGFLADKMQGATIKRFMDNNANAITELTAQLRACVKEYVDGTFALLLAEGNDSVCEAFVNDPRRYAQMAFEYLSQNTKG